MPRAGTDHGSIAAEACWQHQVVPDEWPQLRLRLLLCGVQTSVMAPGIQTSHSRRPWSGPICFCIYDLHGVLLPLHANLCFTFLAKQLRAFLHMLPYCSSCCLSCFCCSSCSRLLFPADLQMVNMSLRLLSKPNEDKLPTIFKVSGGQ